MIFCRILCVLAWLIALGCFWGYPHSNPGGIAFLIFLQVWFTVVGVVAWKELREDDRW